MLFKVVWTIITVERGSIRCCREVLCIAVKTEKTPMDTTQVAGSGSHCRSELTTFMLAVSGINMSTGPTWIRNPSQSSVGFHFPIAMGVRTDSPTTNMTIDASHPSHCRHIPPKPVTTGMKSVDSILAPTNEDRECTIEIENRIIGASTGENCPPMNKITVLDTGSQRAKFHRLNALDCFTAAEISEDPVTPEDILREAFLKFEQISAANIEDPHK
tara:strand:+ start:4166 stop:4813 length:648 start_codon:yes stop_codon:yes gene_type:complete